MTNYDDFTKRKRLFIDRKTGGRARIDLIKRAAEDKYDAIVFPFGEKLTLGNRYIKLAKKYELIVEAGGRDLSLLIQRKLYLFHRDLFRMEYGKRKSKYHFCTTNPETTALITENAEKLFTQALQAVTVPRIFHLLPDKGFENTWCACPACRAFTPAEQNLIAVNTAADALAKLDPDARLSFLDYGTTPGETQVRGGIAPRANMFPLTIKLEV